MKARLLTKKRLRRKRKIRMNDNQRLLLEWIVHVAETERAGKKFSGSMLATFDDFLEELKRLFSKPRTVASKRQYNELLSEAQRLIESCGSSIGGSVDSRAKADIKGEGEFLARFWKKAGASLLVPRNIVAQAEFIPYAGSRTFSYPQEHFERQMQEISAACLRTSYITKGVVLREDSVLPKRSERARKNLGQDIETLCSAAGRNADRVVYSFNSRKVRFVATLDSRTCGQCSSLSGEVFDARSAPQPPLHDNCRCSLVIDMPDIKIPTFSEFIGELSDEDRRAVLGDERDSLYQDGASVDSFVP